VRGSGLKIQDIGSRAWVCGLEFRFGVKGFGVQGLEFRVKG
jgi:hypothetical protein